jgi:hypothetical protein
MSQVKHGRAWLVTAIDPRHVERGQHYRTVRPNGALTSIVWEVVEVSRLGDDGIEHARLRRLDDPSETRTLATSVVADPLRFKQEA